MRPLRLACSFAVATLFFGVPAAAARPHPFGVDDWQTLRSAAPIAVAPDGATILYSVAFGQRQGPTKTEFFTIRADGSGKTKLQLPKDFHAAGFTRSARELYGTQGTKTVDQLALWTAGAKTARIISNVPGGVTSVRLSPDGSRFALIGKPQPPDPLAKLRTVVENEPARLYVTSATGAHGAWWCRGRNHASEFAWSQDGTRIALVEQTPLLGYHRVTSAIDVCSPTSDRRLATFDRGATSVAWTARDTMLAFLSTTTDVLTPDHVWTVPVSGGKPLDRTPDIPFSILALHGDAHGRIWTGVAAGLEAKVSEFRDGKLGRTFANGSVVSMPVSTDLASAPGVLAFGVSTTVHPSEVAVGSAGALHTITHESDAQVTHIAFGKVIRHRWTSADGTQLEAMVTFPPKWNGRPGKFLVLPHGGPKRTIISRSTNGRASSRATASS